jgi:hypothetical protein
MFSNPLPVYFHFRRLLDYVAEENLDKISIKNSTLRFLVEAQSSRKVSFKQKSSSKQKGSGRNDRVYGVVAHVGLKNQATSVQVEAWIRFHMSRGFKMFLFDRYGFHRDIVKYARR